LSEKEYKNDRTRNQMGRSCRGQGQGQMAWFVYSALVLEAESKNKKKKKSQYTRIAGHETFFAYFRTSTASVYAYYMILYDKILLYLL